MGVVLASLGLWLAGVMTPVLVLLLLSWTQALGPQGQHLWHSVNRGGSGYREERVSGCPNSRQCNLRTCPSSPAPLEEVVELLPCGTHPRLAQPSPQLGAQPQACPHFIAFEPHPRRAAGSGPSTHLAAGRGAPEGRWVPPSTF